MATHSAYRPPSEESFSGLDSGSWSKSSSASSLSNSPPHFQSTNQAFREEDCQLGDKVKILPTIPAPSRGAPSYADLNKSYEDAMHDLCLQKSIVIKRFQIPVRRTETTRKYGSDDRLRAPCPMDRLWSRLNTEMEELFMMARNYPALRHLKEPTENLGVSLRELEQARKRQRNLDEKLKSVGRIPPGVPEIRDCQKMLFGAITKVTEALKRINALLGWLCN